MKTILLFVVTLSLVSCVGSPIRTSKGEFLIGNAAPAGVTYTEMRDDLTRTQRSYPGSYGVEAVLMTKPLIEAEEREKGKRTMASELEIRKAIAQSHASLVNGNTCFLFRLQTSYIEAGYFKWYKSKVEDSTGKLFSVTFMFTSGVDSVPNAGAGGGFDKWTDLHFSNSTIGCTDKPVDISRGVKLHFLPISDEKPATLVWTVEASTAAALKKSSAPTSF